jgi:hypothetical protein
MRWAMRASIDGVAIPVTDAKKTWSTSRGSSPACASAAEIAHAPSSTAQRM